VFSRLPPYTMESPQGSARELAPSPLLLPPPLPQTFSRHHPPPHHGNPDSHAQVPSIPRSQTWTFHGCRLGLRLASLDCQGAVVFGGDSGRGGVGQISVRCPKGSHGRGKAGEDRRVASRPKNVHPTLLAAVRYLYFLPRYRGECAWRERAEGGRGGGVQIIYHKPGARAKKREAKHKSTFT